MPINCGVNTSLYKQYTICSCNIVSLNCYPIIIQLDRIASSITKKSRISVRDFLFKILNYSNSIATAVASPPPIHSAAIPFLPPVRFKAWIKVKIMREPVEPTG